MKFKQYLVRWGFLLGAMVVAGCGTTTEHASYFTAVHPGTKARNYYRVKVSAHTDNGNASWQSGWYSRRALDQVFSEITTNGTPAADQMVDLYEESLVALLKKFTEALKSFDKEEAAKAREGIDELIAAARFYMSAGATPKDAAENAGKRLVYSFTADPTLMERLIADALEADRVSATLQGLVTLNSPVARDRMQQNEELVVSVAAGESVAGRIQGAIDAIVPKLTGLANTTDDQKKQLVQQVIIHLKAASVAAE